MNTKNILAAIVVMLFCISLAIGQHKPDKEKIKALKKRKHFGLFIINMS